MAKKTVVRICEESSCVDNGAQEVIKTVEQSMGLALGESNSKYDIDRCACLGGCDFGPNMLVDSEFVMGVRPGIVMAEIAKIAKVKTSSALAPKTKLKQKIESELDLL